MLSLRTSVVLAISIIAACSTPSSPEAEVDITSGAETAAATPAVLLSIAVTPARPTFAAGTDAQLIATGTYGDATTIDLSAMVKWSSSGPTIATVGETGVMQGVAAGNATITARLGTISGTANATVTAAKLTTIEVTPTNPSLAVGTTLQLTATGVFSDHTTQDFTTQVKWASDAAGHVQVSKEGLVTAVAAGSATIKAFRGRSRERRGSRRPARCSRRSRSPRPRRAWRVAGPCHSQRSARSPTPPRRISRHR